MRDTIVAIATATGGGVGMVRLSGPQALAVAGRVFRPMNPAKSPETMPGYTGAFGRVCHGEQLLDEAVLFVYHAPHSYTGEDVAEFCCHGGEFVLSQVLAAVIAAGAVVVNDVEPGAVMAGVPARKIKTKDEKTAGKTALVDALRAL